MNSGTIVCIIVFVILIGVIIRLATNNGKLMEQENYFYEYPYTNKSGLVDSACEICKQIYNKCKSENPVPLYYGNVSSVCDDQMGSYGICYGCNYK